jgi:hypothetical protein
MAWMVFFCNLSVTIFASEADSLAVISINAPAIARAIAADPGLKEVVGTEKWPQALQRLAEFSKNTNTDYREALRIIGDTVPRVKNPVGNIQLDGNPTEWNISFPPPDAGRRHKDQETWSARWDRGAAAVVRQDRLYLMIGLANASNYFDRPDNEVRVDIDCKGDGVWDVCLLLSLKKGVWRVKQRHFGSNEKPEVLPTVQGVGGTVAEIGIAISDFVPIKEAKPIWTLCLKAKAKNQEGKTRWADTHEIPVFNENAREGVAAWPYLQTFLCLCADQPLDGFEITAAAIAIVSSTMYLDGDEEVRKKIRVDNAEFLGLARSIDAWQAQTGAEYRLKKYPLEAQLAWASRIKHSNNELLEARRETGNKNNLEDYLRASTSVETFKNLKTLAIQEGLTNTSLAHCCERIDTWVRAKQVAAYTTSIAPNGHLIFHDRQAREDELKALAGFHFKAEVLLKQFETYGYLIGNCSCGQHNKFSQNIMRAVGIAPLGFWVLRSREGNGDHAWPVRYDPAKNVWLSYQKGPNNEHWYLFFVGQRPPVFSYTAEVDLPGLFSMITPYAGPRPFPLLFCRELQGFDVTKTAKTGIPTKEVREWMLTPGF